MASWRSMIKIEGSGSASGSISQRHGSADPDPDPYQNVMDPEQQWFDGFRSPVTSTPMSFSSVVFGDLSLHGVVSPSCWPMCITLHIGHCWLWWFASFCGGAGWSGDLIADPSVLLCVILFRSKLTGKDESPGSVPDPYIFGPPGSSPGSVIYLYGPGSGSFHQQAKKEETLISTVLWLLYDLKAYFFAFWAGAGSVSHPDTYHKCHGSGSLLFSKFSMQIAPTPLGNVVLIIFLLNFSYMKNHI